MPVTVSRWAARSLMVCCSWAGPAAVRRSTESRRRPTRFSPVPGGPAVASRAAAEGAEAHLPARPVSPASERVRKVRRSTGGEGLSKGGHGTVRGEEDDAGGGGVVLLRTGRGDGVGREAEGLGEVELGVGVGDDAPFPLAYPGPVAAGAQAAAGGSAADPGGQGRLGESAGTSSCGQRVRVAVVHRSGCHQTGTRGHGSGRTGLPQDSLRPGVSGAHAQGGGPFGPFLR